MLAPTAAPAQEQQFLSNVTILDAVVNMDTHSPTVHEATVTVTVTCLVDITSPGWFRGTATLTQSAGSGRLASSLARGFGNAPGNVPCQAGRALVIPIRFSRQQGTFLPGRADIHGFIEVFSDCCTSADVVTIGPATVILHPA